MDGKEIFVAMGGTVTIPTEEYRDLVMGKTYLDMILGICKNGETWKVEPIIEQAQVAMCKVITAKEGTEDA